MIKNCEYCEKEFEDTTRAKQKRFCSRVCQLTKWKKDNKQKCEEYNKKYLKQYYQDNKENLDAQNKLYYIVHKTEIAEYKKEYGKQYSIINKEEISRKQTNSGLKSRYGITIEDKQQMFNNQNGLCKICQLEMIFSGNSCCVDHDHETGKIRGLLCNKCNFALGLFKDSTDILKNAIDYLISSNTENINCVDLDI